MSEHWKQILPVDRYIVKSNGLLHEYDRKILTMLYQPLTGPLCFSLYMTLWGELDMDRLWGEVKTHHSLMGTLQTGLNHLLHERKKLEGIGLLNTFVKRDEDVQSYIYELQPPLTPKQFFEDGLLNIYLYNRVGKTHYNRLKQFFSVDVIDQDQFKSITTPFNEMFVSLHPSELSASNLEMTNSLQQFETKRFVDKNTGDGMKLSGFDFDFDLLMAGLSDTLLPKRVMTADIKELILKLAYIYRLNPIEMKDLVIRSFDPASDEISEDELKELARQWYKFEHTDQLPALSERVMAKKDRTMEGVEPKTKDQELIKKLEIVSPYQLLKEISGGTEPSTSDMRTIEDVMLKQKLNPGVVNVLIYYVMLRSDMKLSKNYVSKIASHWARKKITTVSGAMNLAKMEHKQYQEWALSRPAKQQRSSNRTPELPKKEMIDDEERLKYEELIQKYNQTKSKG